jgi:SAM-dependent methyltransferase
MSELSTSHRQVQDYYGKVLSGTRDLKTSACCSASSPVPSLLATLEKIHPEVLDRFYGCGSPIPEALEGCTVLDLGCGTGRDVFLCAVQVGPEGKALGIDMTEEQLEVANRHRESQCEALGISPRTVEFRHGYMEDLLNTGVEDESIDVVISNCVLNLSPAKEQVFAEIVRVLKPGGELYFSDVFADRRLPKEWFQDPVLLGECLAGALYTEDFRRLLLRLGLPDYRVVARNPILIANPEIAAKVGAAQFSSLTVRAFKIASLEDRCENYGQTAFYHGTVPGFPEAFPLDDHHLIPKDEPFRVCGNTAAMLEETRFARHFTIVGDRSGHQGLFDCGPAGQGECCCVPDASGGCC